jgi:hypothetical protein
LGSRLPALGVGRLGLPLQRVDQCLEALDKEREPRECGNARFRREQRELSCVEEILGLCR